MRRHRRRSRRGYLRDLIAATSAADSHCETLPESVMRRCVPLVALMLVALQTIACSSAKQSARDEFIAALNSVADLTANSAFAEGDSVRVVYDSAGEDDTWNGTVATTVRGIDWLVEFEASEDQGDMYLATGSYGPLVYSCWAVRFPGEEWIPYWSAEMCEVHEESEETGEFLAAFTGQLGAEGLLDYLNRDREVTIERDGKRRAAGIEGECYHITGDDDTDYVACISKDTGLLLFGDGTLDGEYARAELLEYSTEVSDDDLLPMFPLPEE
jgi:hypothetical protein